MNTLCFIDLDGVLADFVDSAFQKHNIQIPWADIRWDFVEQAGLNPVKFWESLGYSFWKNVFRTLECEAIISAAEKKFGATNIFICSSPCKTKGCVVGKSEWVEIHLPGYERRLILTDRKEIFSGPGRVLIDDRDENITGWIEMGGIGILVPRPWNASRTPLCDVRDIVTDAIERI